jgi:exodeoxyribonuclease VII small subunit
MAESQSGPEPSERPTFERALERLEAIVRELEEGQVGLADAMTRYQQGVHLLRYCHELLQRAERQVALLSGVDAEGKPISAPLDDSAASLAEKARSRSRRRSATTQPLPPESGINRPSDSDMDDSAGLF